MTSAVAKPLDRERLARPLGMLGSDFDNEVLSAARLAERLRLESGTSWHAIVNPPIPLQQRDHIEERLQDPEARERLAAVLDDAETVIADFRNRLQEVAEALDLAQRDAHEKLRDVAIPEPYETPQPIITPAPEPLYSSRDTWRTATEKMIGYRDLGGDLGEEDC